MCRVGYGMVSGDVEGVHIADADADAGAVTALSRCFVRSNGSAFCPAAFCLAGGPPGYGGDRRVSLV